MTPGQPPTVALVGPTAAGKSAVALEVAARSRAQVRVPARTPGAESGPGAPGTTLPPVELVSVDSMAVYRDMDIGTAKPTRTERSLVPYHLLDLVDPSEEFTVRQFQLSATEALSGIAARENAAVLVGGTGLYLRAVVDSLTFPGRYPEVAGTLEAELEATGPEGSPARGASLAALHRRLAALDPVAAARMEPTNQRRLVRALEVTLGSGRPFSSFGPGLVRYPDSPVVLVGIGRDLADLDDRIAERFTRLLEAGFVDEVRRLAARPGGLSRTARQALGYRELLTHVEEGRPLTEAVDEAVRRTRAFARRQMAWFRRDPRIRWVGAESDPAAAVLDLLAGSRAVGDCRRP